MKKINILAAMGFVVMMSGCAAGRAPVNNGLIFTSLSGSESISANQLGTKSGEGCATNILGMFAFGDASINNAARKAGITKASHVDYNTHGFLGLFSTSCTVVYGE